jgi:geranylgeranyl reductase family protein
VVTEGVIVVGAGPAGCAAAIALRRRGVSVLVLDRAVFPRDKVCGDVILPQAREALAALGVDVSEIAPRAYACTGARYFASGGTEINGLFRDTRGELRPWWLLKRVVFDEWLMNTARSMGARVLEGWSVRGLLRSETGAVTGVCARSPDGELQSLPARAVVGADGAGSIVARESRLSSRPDDHTCVAVRTYATGVSLPEPYVEVFTTRQTLPGCAWIVPVGRDECNVGLGVLKRSRCHPAELFDQVRERIPQFAARLAGARLGPLQGWMLPGASQRRPLSGDGFVLAGDAGAMVDPFTGHGIHCALVAGRLVGDVLAGALAAGDLSAAALSQYDTRFRALLGPELDAGFALQRMHSRASLVKPLVQASHLHAGLRRLFIALLGHADSRRQLLGKRRLARILLGSAS